MELELFLSWKANLSIRDDRFTPRMPLFTSDDILLPPFDREHQNFIPYVFRKFTRSLVEKIFAYHVKGKAMLHFDAWSIGVDVEGNGHFRLPRSQVVYRDGKVTEEDVKRHFRLLYEFLVSSLLYDPFDPLPFHIHDVHSVCTHLGVSYNMFNFLCCLLNPLPNLELIRKHYVITGRHPVWQDPSILIQTCMDLEANLAIVRRAYSES